MPTPNKMLFGLEPLLVDSYTILLQRGCAAPSTINTDYVIEFDNAYPIDIRIYGAGGRDYPGSLIPGWHYIWLLYNSDTGQSAAIASMAELGGDLMIPPGYTHIRKLSSFAFYYAPGGIQRYVFVNWPAPYIVHTEADNGTKYRALLNGVATAWTSVTFGANLMPPSGRLVRVQSHVQYVTGSGSAYLRTPGVGSGLLVGSATSTSANQRESVLDLAVSSDRRLEYKVTPGVQLSLYVLGYHIQETY